MLSKIAINRQPLQGLGMAATCFQTWMHHDGAQMTLRLVQADDAGALNDMVKRLSYASRRNRFHSAINALAPRTLQRMTEIDPDRHCAFVVLASRHGQQILVADGRYAVTDGDDTAEFAIVVDDQVQRCGIGQRVMCAMLQMAQLSGLACLRGDVFCNNTSMIALAKHCGFACVGVHGDPQLVRAQKMLNPCQDRAIVPVSQVHDLWNTPVTGMLPC